MNTTTSFKNTQKNGNLVNIAIIVVLLLAAVPAVLFGIMQVLPPMVDTSVKTAIIEDAPKRSTTAERRAQRREAREAARKTKETASIETYTINSAPAMGGFGPDMNGFGGGFTPDMNGFGGFGGGFAPDMNGFGGFGGGFAPDMNGFGGFGGGFAPDMNGFGGGFGGFGDIGELPGDRV